MADVQTPCCPLCDTPPAIVLTGGTQAFCGNGRCTLLCWNPSLSLDESLLGASVVQWRQS